MSEARYFAADDTAAATGLPSASTTVTSPRSIARMPASIFDRSPTMIQVIAFGSKTDTACCTIAGVSDSMRALRWTT